MKHFGIRKQTLLVALIPILVMAVLLESYIIYSRFADLERELLERSNLLVRQLASSSEYAVFSNNTALLQQNVNTVLTQHDVSRVAILDASAKLLLGGSSGVRGQYETLLAKATRSTPIVQDEDALTLYQPIIATQIKLNDLDRESGFTSVPSAPLGAVILEISKHRLIRQKHEVLILSLATSLLILMTALMLAVWASRRITRPIIAMSEAIRNFGQGNLDKRITFRPEVLELADLTTGFNEMAQKLQHHQEILETRVEARTLALAVSELGYRTLIENSPDTIARYNSELRRTYVNPAFCALTEGGSAALLGKTPSEYPGGPNSEIYEANLKEVFTNGENRHFELKWLGKDGKEICSHIRLTAERDTSGKIISVMGVGHNVTELNQSRDELKRKELAKSRFLAAAGHDLRQPLAAANLFIDALRFADPSPEQTQIIRRIDQAMSNFNELLDALLNISKLDAGIIRPEYTSIHVIEIINWLEQSFEPIARQKQLAFKLYFPMKEALVIYSDIDLLKSVLMNLVSNAIKYTPKGGILVSARRRGAKVLFQVWDTGMGIKEEYIQHIYDEFYQVENPHRDKSGGLGLGLAISKRALSLLGENISCRSRFGRGSVFEFSLPLDKSDCEVLPHPEIEPAMANVAQASFAQGKHFVVVEDDALVAEALCKALVTLGGKVELFQNAEEALLNVNLEHENYYIADYNLGGALDGLEFLNQLSQLLDKPIAAVLMTGDTSPAFIRKAENCAWTVLHKPINITKLISGLGIQAQ